MAECKICGTVEQAKPQNWENWDCPECVTEEIGNTDGTLSPFEKKIKHAIRDRNIKS